MTGRSIQFRRVDGNISQSRPFSPFFPQLPTQQLKLMTSSENEAILKQANDCAAGECSLDDVDELIHVLQAQQHELSERLKQVTALRESLQKINSENNRPVDEIRETVRAIFRVFQLGDKASGNDYPSLSKPMGYPGEVGSGPTTAYDALPPKRTNKKTP
jgi:hypothetical protein